jgi:hypothetical protein
LGQKRRFFLVLLDTAEKKANVQLFLYGFPYNRAWDQVRDYLYAQEGVRNIYTNDNDTIAQYYLRKFDYTPPGANYFPQYYIDVANNQEFRTTDVLLLENYVVEKEFFVDRTRSLVLYR